ncbi:Putative amidase domain-containing protein [Gracilibacillus orientalis]|uniref:Putative amidase domain-containing protein n=1 Tax=Gracilibacillus orientalis TaxID=334253 RepID=A0A1I4ILY2_9BACI|nr:amidase domain-containing protein [Gracilibacillus orientalis]SFL54821.1 Putative amidase domain-containing protein [Gracilibacillus orientalis]
MSEWELIKSHWKDNWKQNEHSLHKKQRLHRKNGKSINHIDIIGKKQDTTTNGDRSELTYQLYMKLFIKDQDNFYHEELVEQRIATIESDKLIADKEILFQTVLKPEKIEVDQNPVRFAYDRRAAVQYAERWWNDANPAYRVFEDNDCTNYISQCLRAGGAPMHGASNRSKGWWYQNNNWSYSWSVANALRWYLSGATSGLKGTEISDPENLLPGDVICYDFQGDGRWDHNTIVVAKDSQNMPLVNAHTNNSRHRYWAYEDSAAWTPDCNYRFFRIGEEDRAKD